MDLLLTLVTHDDIGAGVVGADGRLDVLASAEPGATVADLADALALHLRGGARGESVTLSIDGRTALAADERIDRTALRHGAYVTVRPGVEEQRTRLLPPVAMPATTSAALLVRTGPRAGERIELASGETVIGRSRTANVQLDDPSVGRQHARIVTRVEHGATVAVISDLGSSNGTLVDGTPISEPTVLHGTEKLTFGTTELDIELGAPVVAPVVTPVVARAAVPARVVAVEHAPDTHAATDERVEHGEVAVNRPPRLTPIYAGRQHRFPKPPDKPGRVRLPMIAAVAPLIAGLVTFALTRQVATLAVVFLSPLMAVGSQWERRRQGVSGNKEAVAAWRRAIAALDESITAEQQIEASARRAELPEPALVLAQVPGRHGLWTRRPTDPDFGIVRLGVGERPTRQDVAVEAGGDIALADAHLGDVPRRYQLLSGLPVAGSAVRGSIGIAGPLDPVEDLARSIAVQLAVQQSPAELAIAALLPDDHAERWDWLKWLPHTRSGASPISGAHLASGAAACADLVRRIGEVLDDDPSPATGAARSADAPPERNLVVLVDAAAPVDVAALTSLMRAGAAKGVGFVWFGTDATAMPAPCTTIVSIDDTGGLGDTRWVGEPEGCRGMRVEGLELGPAKGVGRGLAALRDATSREHEEDLPSNVLLVDLLGGVEVLREPQRIVDRWSSSRSLRAPVGLTPGEELSIDIIADGPHGFIVGTTGSGKSELMRSLLVSMAATHSPRKLSLLLIDFKGGAAFLPMLALPHTIGLVTNLRQNSGGGDAAIEQNVRRALVWLRAELNRRMRLFAERKVSDLKELERAGVPETPPRLVIVADEFAVLARSGDGRSGANVIDEMVDIARLGRSLGIHLLLATQQATGVITPKIQANTNLRIALRLQDPSESTDVVGTKAAAAIAQDRPGRAFLRIGNREAVQLQTASTIGTSLVESSRPPTTVASTFGVLGRLGPVTEVDAPLRIAADAPDDFTALLAAVRSAAELASDDGVALRPAVPWTDPLTDLVAFDELPAPATGEIVIGLIDDPSSQAHAPATIDFDHDGSVLVFGAGGSGKTSMLRIVALALARADDADHVNIYGLDFAGRGLHALAELPQVGAVIGSDDPERVQRLLGGLRDTIRRRSEAFAAVGATTLLEYRTRAAGSGATDDRARIVVLLDGLHGFVSEYESVDNAKWVAALTQLATEGRQVGVHLVIAADRRTGAPMSLLSAVSRKFVLRLANADEYTMLDLKPTFGSSPPAGRGMIDGLELQLGFPSDPAHVARFRAASREGDVAEMDRVLSELRSGEAQQAGIAAEIERARARSALVAPGVGRLPERVDATSLPRAEGMARVHLGIADDDLVPFALALDGPLLIAGPPRSGKTTTIGTLARGLDAAIARPQLVLATNRRNPLSALRWDHMGTDETSSVAALTAVLSKPTPAEGLVIMIDDVLDFVGTPVEALLRQVLDRSRTEPIVLVAAGDIQGLRGAFADWLRTLRSYGRGVLLQPNVDLDGDVLATRLPRRRIVSVPGRGYVVDRGGASLVQVAS